VPAPVPCADPSTKKTRQADWFGLPRRRVLSGDGLATTRRGFLRWGVSASRGSQAEFVPERRTRWQRVRERAAELTPLWSQR